MIPYSLLKGTLIRGLKTRSNSESLRSVELFHSPVERRNVNSFRVKPFNYHYLISQSGEFANLSIL